VYERLAATRPPDEVVDLRGARDLGAAPDLVAAPAPGGGRLADLTQEER